MPRQSRIDFPGALHHVIVRGVARGRIVDDDADRTAFLKELGALLPPSDTSCLAWALLPNHAHLLLRTGATSLGRLMQRLLTRHAGAYNRRHRRAGHLFQNRYKAILCEEEPYLLAVVRYIHLNPLRAGLVRSMAALDRYPWCGHAAMMGAAKTPWHEAGEVLSLFAKAPERARTLYRQFMAEGLANGDPTSGGPAVGQRDRPDPLSEIVGLGPREGDRSDPRILGGGAFVGRVMAKVEAADRRRDRSRRRVTPDAVVRAAARVAGIPNDAIRRPNRRPAVVIGRALACKWLVEDLGLSGVEVARLLGITGAAVTQGVERGRRLEIERTLSLENVT